MITANNVLICVTRQKACERLIRVGNEIALKKRGRPYVIHVARVGEKFLGNPREGEALDYLFNISKQVGAEMIVQRSNKIVDILVDFVERNDIGVMILGESPENKNNNNIIMQLQYKLPDIEFVVVSQNS